MNATLTIPKKKSADELRSTLEEAQEKLRKAKTDEAKASGDVRRLESELLDLHASEAVGDLSSSESSQRQKEIRAKIDKARSKAEASAGDAAKHNAVVTRCRQEIGSIEAEEVAEARKELAEEVLALSEKIGKALTEAGELSLEIKRLMRRGESLGIKAPGHTFTENGLLPKQIVYRRTSNSGNDWFEGLEPTGQAWLDNRRNVFHAYYRILER